MSFDRNRSKDKTCINFNALQWNLCAFGKDARRCRPQPLPFASRQNRKVTRTGGKVPW